MKISNYLDFICKHCQVVTTFKFEMELESWKDLKPKEGEHCPSQIFGAERGLFLNKCKFCETEYSEDPEERIKNDIEVEWRSPYSGIGML